MRPIDFVMFDGDSSPYTPVYQIAEALNKPIVVMTPNGPLQILGYYYDSDAECLVLDIGD